MSTESIRRLAAELQEAVDDLPDNDDQASADRQQHARLVTERRCSELTGYTVARLAF